MAAPFNDSIQNNSNKPLDNKYAKYVSGATVAYSSVADVNATIDIAYRSLGLTVLIDTVDGEVEYWYYGGIANINLIVKTSKTIDVNVAFVRTNGDDATAELGSLQNSYDTISAALNANATVPYLIIDIGIGDFSAPLEAEARSNVWYRGAGKPVPNITITVDINGNDTATVPTKLQHGTVLKGSFSHVAKSNVEVSDLGVDVGSEYCNANTGGVAQQGILFAQFYNLGGGGTAIDGIHCAQVDCPPVTGVFVRNITVLCKQLNSPVHAALFENLYDPIIDNITTYYGFYGVVIKSIGGIFSNLICRSHFDCGVVIKANDYANCKNITVTGVEISSLSGKEGAGLDFHSEDVPLSQVTLSNFTIYNCAYGIALYTIGVAPDLILINISDGQVYDCTGDGFDTDGHPFENSSLSNIVFSGNGGVGCRVQPSSGYVNIRGIKCFNNTGGGFALSSPDRIDVCDIVADGNGGTSIAYGSNIFTMGVSNLSGSVTGSSTAR